MFHLRNFNIFISCVLVFIIQSGHGTEIIGGKKVKPHSMPFMALLESNKPACGGTLIDPSWVLTAAHCNNISKVILGVHAIKKKEKKSRQVREVDKHFPHLCYRKTENDLMLLKLNKPVETTSTVKCLQLGTTIKDPAAGSSCLVAGWGKTKNKVKKMSDVLMSASVTVIDRVKCNSKDFYNHNPVITRDMICAGSNGKKKADTCGGDSGGPLLCNGALVGVTSFGSKKCGDFKKPGVYSFLSEKQLKWIKSTMKSTVMK